MKYFTKEFYEKMQQTSYHLSLMVQSEAKIFSEEYFKTLYNYKLDEYLNVKKQIAEMAANKKILDIKYDEENEKISYGLYLKSKVKELKKVLPENILDKIADIRVLALGIVESNNIKNLIKEFCNKNKKFVENIFSSYSKYYKNFIKEQNATFLKNFHFHDCKITSVKKIANDFIINIDGFGGITKNKQIIFKDCSGDKDGKEILGTWIYEEIYYNNNCYEIQILIANLKSNTKYGLEEYTLTASNVIIKKL